MKSALMRMITALAIVMEGVWLTIVMFHPLTTSAHPSASPVAQASPPPTPTVGCNPSGTQKCILSDSDVNKLCAGARLFEIALDGSILCTQDGKTVSKTISYSNACKILLGSGAIAIPLSASSQFDACSKPNKPAPTPTPVPVTGCNGTSTKSICIITQSDLQAYCAIRHFRSGHVSVEATLPETLKCPGASFPTALSAVCAIEVGLSSRLTSVGKQDGCTSLPPGPKPPSFTDGCKPNFTTNFCIIIELDLERFCNGNYTNFKLHQSFDCESGGTFTFDQLCKKLVGKSSKVKPDGGDDVCTPSK